MDNDLSYLFLTKVAVPKKKYVLIAYLYIIN